jgi:hypothetical protein
LLNHKETDAQILTNQLKSLFPYQLKLNQSKFMIWKTPKRFIQQTLFWTSLFSLSFSLLVLGGWIYWQDHPEKIIQFDHSIPNYHEEKII